MITRIRTKGVATVDVLECSSCSKCSKKPFVKITWDKTEIKCCNQYIVHDDYKEALEIWNKRMATNIEECLSIWEDIASIPINKDYEIEEEFLHFKEGSSKTLVVDWFETIYRVSFTED